MMKSTQVQLSGRVIPDGLNDELVEVVVDRFYQQARRDLVLGPIFNRVIAEEDWPGHLSVIAKFWSSMLLGSGTYNGRPMQKHLPISDLSDEHFARWLELFQETVTASCPPDVAALFVDRSERIAHSFRIGLAMHRGQDTLDIRLLRAGGPGSEHAPLARPDDV